MSTQATLFNIRCLPRETVSNESKTWTFTLEHCCASWSTNAAAIRDAVELPLIVDIDTGFGNALNVRQTIRTIERAGANAVQLEDQVSPKKCGHFAGKGVIAKTEMLGKIKAAVDARQNSDFLIIARTDARAVNGMDDALDRAAAFAECGADITFVEAPETVDEMRTIAAQTHSPQVVNVVIGGKTPRCQPSNSLPWGLAWCCMPTRPFRARFAA